MTESKTETQIPLQYDPNTPVTSHPGLAAELYAPYLFDGQSIIDVAAGGTDLAGDLAKRGVQVHVTAVDPSYAGRVDQGRTTRVPGYAQKLDFADESFDVGVVTYGMQHLSEEDRTLSIRELIRVTRRAEHAHDGKKGVIFINPVYATGKLRNALAGHGLDSDDCGIVSDDVDSFLLQHKQSVKPTFYIHKTPTLTEEKVEALLAAVTESGALKPAHRSLGEMASRAFRGRSRR